MLSCDFCEIIKNNFFTEHLRETASDFVNKQNNLNRQNLNLWQVGIKNFTDTKFLIFYSNVDHRIAHKHQL